MEEHERNRARVDAKRRAYKRAWAAANRGTIARQRRRYYAESPAFRLSSLLRSRLAQALGRKTKRGSAVGLLGCTPDEAAAHIASLFKPGMTWDNHGEWEIDHKIPMAAFDLEDPAQLALVCNFSNLQPLWKHENRAKSDQVDRI